MSRLYTPPVIKFTPRRNRPTPNPTTHNPAPHPTTAAPKPTTPPCDLAPRAVSSPTPATATAHTPTTTSCYYTEDTPSRSVEEATKTAKPAPTPESNSSPQSAPSLGKPPEKSESGSGCYYGDCGLKPGIEASPPKLQVGPQDQGNGNTNAPPPTNSQIELCTYGSSEEDVPIPEAIVHDRLNEKHSSDMYYSGEVIPKQAKTPEGKEREGGGEDEVQDAEVYYGTAPSGTSSTAGSETNAFSHQIPNQVYGSTQPLSADERKESSGSPESDSHSEEDSDTAGNHSHSDDDDDEESTAASGESVLTLNATYGSSETRENNCLPTSQKSDTCGMAYGESEEINTTTPSSPKATVPTHKEGEVTTEDSPHQVTEKYYGSTSSNQEPTVHVKAVAPIPVDSPSNHYEEITVHASPTLEADNKTTVERDSTSSVHPPEDPKRNWNEEFQSLFEKPVTTPFDRNVRGQNLKKLLDDFERFAAQTACCIVTEIGVDNKEKQLPPIGGGRAGGEKFKHGNILFKFARDYAKMYGSDEMARKTAANELRNMNAVIDCNLPNLHVPLTTLINLYGHTIVATAIVPIGEDSLVYGTPDAGKTVKDSDPVVKGMMKQIATRLSLQPHLFRELEFFAAADVECHRSKVDGRYYLIDCGTFLMYVT
ncbi:Histidine kinase A [Pelomyxa schiedti]|nr:Histidine kinase A [Pelomyxa schiedti]